jgi:hypothetical protein
VCRLDDEEAVPYAPFRMLQQLQKLQFGARSLDVLQVGSLGCMCGEVMPAWFVAALAWS